MNNIDLEALPTGQWGYYYFPMAVRYTRTFGLTTQQFRKCSEAGVWGGTRMSLEEWASSRIAKKDSGRLKWRASTKNQSVFQRSSDGAAMPQIAPPAA